MSYRKNATTIVLKPRTKNQRTNALKGTMKSYMPKRNQRNFLNQADLGYGPELKGIDLNTTFSAPLTASFATPQLLNGIPNGSAGNERVGRRILMKSIQWRAICGTGTPFSQHRIVVVYDKQPNATSFGLTDLFELNVFTAPLNLRNADRFVIVHDEITDSTQSSALNISAKRYSKCNLETLYTGTGSTISNITSGALWMTVANNADPTVGASSSVYVHTRVRYVDS